MQLGLQGYRHLALGQRKALLVEGIACAKAWSMQDLEHRGLGEKVVAGELRPIS